MLLSVQVTSTSLPCGNGPRPGGIRFGSRWPISSGREVYRVGQGLASSPTSTPIASTSYSPAQGSVAGGLPVSQSLLHPTKVARAPVQALPANSWGKRTITEEPSNSGGDGGDDEEPTWGFFDLKRYSHKWDVPWGPGTVVGGVVLWLFSFAGTGFFVVPGQLVGL